LSYALKILLKYFFGQDGANRSVILDILLLPTQKLKKISVSENDP